MHMSEPKPTWKNEAALRLLDSWLQDTSGYDERVWPIVKKSIEDNRTSYRPRFRNTMDDAEWGDWGRERTVLFGALLAVLASAALAVGLVWLLVTIAK